MYKYKETDNFKIYTVKVTNFDEIQPTLAQSK